MSWRITQFSLLSALIIQKDVTPKFPRILKIREKEILVAKMELAFTEVVKQINWSTS